MPPQDKTDIRAAWGSLSQEQRDDALKQMQPDEIENLATRLGWFRGGATVSAAPARGSIPWLKQQALGLVERTSRYLPTVGGAAGGVAGGALATPADVATGPLGTAAGAAAGSYVGGAMGEAARQGLLHLAGLDNEPENWEQRAGRMADAGDWNAVSELVGQGAGRMLRPTLSRSLAKLYYAGGLKAHDNGALESVFEDIARTEKLMGNKATTVGGFLNVLNQAKRNIGNEVDTELLSKVKRGGKLIALGDAEIVPMQVADRLTALTTAHPSEAELNPAGLKMFKDRALLYQKLRSFKWLTDRRTVLNDHLAGLYEMAPGEQRLYLNEHPELAADKVEADAIRDTIYPEMDRYSAKPPGTTAKLQQRRGAIMGLSATVQKHLDKLQVASKKIAGAPLLERGNISAYATGAGRPGLSAHRLTSLIHTPNPERSAGQRVAAAFGHTAGAKVAGALSNPTGMEVMSFPLRYLATPDAPPEEQDEETQSPPTLKELRDEAARRAPAPQ